MSEEKRPFALRFDVEKLNSEKVFQHFKTFIFTGHEQEETLSNVGMRGKVPFTLINGQRDQTRIFVSIFIKNNEDDLDFVVDPEEVTLEVATALYYQLSHYDKGFQGFKKTFDNCVLVLKEPSNPANVDRPCFQAASL